jgi:SNF2 family DNA or RNA helicase
MFNIDPKVILNKTTNLVFKRGMEYYRENRVKSMQFNQEKLTFDTTVVGTRTYNIKIFFKDDGDIKATECNCASHVSYWGYCKHIVAVLMVIRDKDREGFFKQVTFRKVAKQIFGFFQNRPNIIKTPLAIEINYVFGNYGAKSTYSAITLKAGLDKLYIVRNLKEFLICMEKNKTIDFGKSFTFDPSIQCFKDDDIPVMDFINEIYQNEKLLDFHNSYALNRQNFFKDKQVLLSDSGVKRFFDIIGNKPFNAEILGKQYNNISIIQNDFPIDFVLSKDDDDLVLNIEFEGEIVPLTEDGEYFFVGEKIYKTSKRQHENFKPFYMAMLYQKGRKIRFLEEDKERFVSEVLPFAEKVGQLTISEKVQSLIERIDLEPEIYLDKSGDSISGDVKFKYGERVINPFLPLEKQNNSSDKILLRDPDKERAILDILGETEFTVRNGKIYLDQEDKIFDFIFNTTPKLQEYTGVYYSENFKNMTLRASLSFSGGLRLNQESDMLEFSFNIDGIDRSEIKSIFESFKEKKKYFRLKNGSYVPLNSKEMIDMVDIIDYLGIGKNDFQKDFIDIPKYRALYLDRQLKDSGIQYLEKNHAFKEFVQNVEEPSDMDFKMPEELKPVLRDYQKFGFKWLKTLAFYGLGGILADDMGLGKTLQIISIILADKIENGIKPSLIVVPTSLVYNWCAEVEKFAPGLKIIAISGNKEERLAQLKSIHEYDLVVTSYPLIRRDIDEYKEYKFRYCILDEAQHIKNPNSVNARSVKQVLSEKHFALTGTPIENSLTELWSIFDFVMPGYLFSHSKFFQKYEAPISKGEGKHELEDLGKHIKPFLLRRLKTDVLKELPEKIENRMVAELTDEQKKVYIAYLEKIKGEIDKEIAENGFEKSQMKILAGLTRLRQICCHPTLFLEDYTGESGKLQMLQEVVQDSIEGGHRILLFSQFTSMLSIIKSWFDNEKIEYLYLDGSTPSLERGKLVKNFNEGQSKVFLISLKAGGTGLNLTGADMVIHYDPWWNPAVEDQATDRAYRIGQKKRVHAIKLITKGTIEEKIYKLQERKRELINAVIQPGETLLNKLTQAEIRELFE